MVVFFAFPAYTPVTFVFPLALFYCRAMSLLISIPTARPCNLHENGRGLCIRGEQHENLGFSFWNFTNNLLVCLKLNTLE